MKKITRRKLNALNGESKFILPLQFFAENEESENGGDDNEEDEEDVQKQKTFTQSELDSAISKAIESNSKKLAKKYESLLEKAKEQALEEGETLASLSEKEKEMKKLEAREKLVAEKEAKLLKMERLSTIKSNLLEAKLPEKFADILVLESDDEKVLETIEGLSKEFEEIVKTRVAESLNQPTPKGDKSKSKGNDNFVESLAEMNFGRVTTPKNNFFK